MFLTLLSFAFIITVLVFIHELGHYLAARSVGMRVEKFSVGFPPRFLSFTSVQGGWDFKLFFYKKSEEGKWVWGPILERFIKSTNKKGSGTEYCLALMPLGGYVKVSGILDESMDPDSTGADYEYQSKKTWQKLWFTSAGVIFNFILSFILFVFLFIYNGYSKNQLEYVVDKLPNVSAQNIKINNQDLSGDDHFFMGVDYSPSQIQGINSGIINIDDSKGNLFIRNINAQKINNVSFRIPVKSINEIRGGIMDSLGVSINFDNYKDKMFNSPIINIELNNNNISNQRNIYIGEIYHSSLNYPVSPSHEILKANDRIISVNGKEVKYYKDIAPLIAQDRVANLDPLGFFYQIFPNYIIDMLEPNNIEYFEMLDLIYSKKVEEIEFKYERDGLVDKVKIKPIISTKYDPYGNLLEYNKVGVTFKTEDVSFFESVSISFFHVIESIGGTFKGIFELITGQLSAKAVSGPIGIAKISGEFASKGFVPLLSLMALLSISLGVINILPFPGLDGGHALIAIIEKIKGSKISAKTQVKIQQFGMLVLMSLFLLIILKDLGIL